MRGIKWLAVCGMTVAVMCGKVQAGLIIQGAETGGDVVFSLSGDFDITGATSGPNFFNTGSSATAIPGGGRLDLGIGNTGDRYDATSHVNFGDIVATTTSNVSGDFFALNGSNIVVPDGFQSGSLSAVATFSGETFASMGIDTSSAPYVWTLDGDPSQTVTLQFSSTSTVPEPSSIALFGLGAMGMAVVAVRRRKQTQTA